VFIELITEKKRKTNLHFWRN